MRDNISFTKSFKYESDQKKKIRSFLFSKKLFLLTIIIGIIFRIFTLNYFFWHDEIWTLLRVSGYTQTELTQEITESTDKNFLEVATLTKYQTTNNNKKLPDTFNSLITEDAQLTPVYFVLSRFWMNSLGDSLIATRILPLLFSLAIFPCIYWLCRELFQSNLIGWVAMTLVAISPVHLFFSTYVRFYSLSTVTILISCIMLLRAMHNHKKLSWILYTISLTISFYTYLFSALVAIGHGIYVLLVERLKPNKKVIAYMVSSLVAIICFLPWLIIINKSLSNVEKNTSWLSINPSIKTRILSWLHNFSVTFFDVSNVLIDAPLLEKILLVKLPDIISFLLVVYSFYFLFIKGNKQSYLFIFTLAGSTSLSIILGDIYSGKVASFNHRYLLPSFLAIELSVAHLISSQISSFNTKNRKYGYSIFIGLLLSGILSCSVLVSKGPWQGSLRFKQLTPSDLQERTQIINQSKSPVLFGDPSPEGLLSISRQLRPDIKILIASKESAINTLNKALNYSHNVFLYDSSLPLEQTLSKQENLRIVPILSQGNRVILQKIERK